MKSKTQEVDVMAHVKIMSKWASMSYGGKANEWTGLGWIACIEASKTHKKNGLSMKNWAWWRFKDLIHTELAISKKTKKEETENDGSPPVFIFEQDFDIRINIKWLATAVFRLSAKEIEILQMRYGLNGHEPKTLKAIAYKLNITSERVRQIEVRTLQKLRVWAGVE